MSKLRPETGLVLQSLAQVSAEDRHRVLDEVCQRVLQPFIGRKITPTLMVEAESTLCRAIDDAVRAGNYVLPDGLVVDRVYVGDDMRIKVLFKTAAGNPFVKRIRMSENTLRAIQKPWGREADEAPAEVKLKDRFEAVAAEIDNMNDEEPT